MLVQGGVAGDAYFASAGVTPGHKHASNNRILETTRAPVRIIKTLSVRGVVLHDGEDEACTEQITASQNLDAAHQIGPLQISAKIPAGIRIGENSSQFPVAGYQYTTAALFRHP